MKPRSFSARDDIEAFLAGYPRPVEQLALGLRALVLECIPGPEEILDRSARVIGYGFGAGYKDTVCAIILSQKGVKLGLGNGAGCPIRRSYWAVQANAIATSPSRLSLISNARGVKPLLKACYAEPAQPANPLKKESALDFTLHLR